MTRTALNCLQLSALYGAGIPLNYLYEIYNKFNPKLPESISIKLNGCLFVHPESVETRYYSLNSPHGSLLCIVLIRTTNKPTLLRENKLC